MTVPVHGVQVICVPLGIGFPPSFTTSLWTWMMEAPSAIATGGVAVIPKA
ncbi:hypothetical protein HS121_17670 [bacterium]|nr:hypothetical protein [bacterium]